MCSVDGVYNLAQASSGELSSCAADMVAVWLSFHVVVYSLRADGTHQVCVVLCESVIFPACEKVRESKFGGKVQRTILKSPRAVFCLPILISAHCLWHQVASLSKKPFQSSRSQRYVLAPSCLFGTRHSGLAFSFLESQPFGLGGCEVRSTPSKFFDSVPVHPRAMVSTIKFRDSVWWIQA